MRQVTAPYTGATNEPLIPPVAWNLSTETALWIGLAIAAFATRLWRLDLAPLSNAEARYALDSLNVLRGGAVSTANPLLASVQTIVMAVFGASDFSVRLPSALAGAVLCILPAALRHETGKRQALVFSALLILSPALQYASRQASGGILAWTFALWAFLNWRRGQRVSMAVAAGLLLACGQDAVTPLLVVSAGAALTLLAQHRRVISIGLSPTHLVIAGAIFVAATTAVLWRPSGLGDSFNGFAAWWSSLFAGGSLGLLRVFAGLSFYETLLIGSAAAGVMILLVQRKPRLLDTGWLSFIAVGMLLLVVNGSRTVADIAPILIGCAGSGAAAWAALWQSYQRHIEPLWSEGIVITVTLLMLVYAYLGLTMFAEQQQSAYLVSIFLAVLMIAGTGIICTLLLDGMAAIRGINTAIGIGLLVYTISVGYHLTQVRTTNPAEAYVSDASSDGLPLLVKTIEDTGIRAYSGAHAMPLQVSDAAPAALRWTLRDQRNITYVAKLTDSPAALTPINEKPESTSAYIGSAFRITNTASLNELGCQSAVMGINQFDCPPLLRWLIRRTLDERIVTRWVLWLRSDTASRASGMH